MVSTVPSRFPEQCACIFVFRSKKYFFDISISGGRTGERKGQRYHRSSLNSVRAFSFFDPKIFLRYLNFMRSHR